MPNEWNRQPQPLTLLIGLVIIGIIGYLLFPNILKDIDTSSSSNPSTNSNSYPSSNPSSNPNLNPNTPSSSEVYLGNIFDSSTLNPPASNSQLFPTIDNTLPIRSGNNDLITGYWVLYVSNDQLQQLSISAQDYAFLLQLIQNDTSGKATTKLFLIENGQIHQYFVSNEIYSILANIATIYTRTSAESASTNPDPLSIVVNVTLTVSNPSTSGFTVSLNPALNGLTASNFSLVDSSGLSVPLISATTSDDGTTYNLTAELSEGQTYSVTASSTGYAFGTPQSIVVDSTLISETVAISNPSTSGFTVLLNPALSEMTTSHFKLVNTYGNSVYLNSVTTSDHGASYDITATLSAGQTYTLTVEKAGYTFGTALKVEIPL